jgi:hypothetical protein
MPLLDLLMNRPLVAGFIRPPATHTEKENVKKNVTLPGDPEYEHTFNGKLPAEYTPPPEYMPSFGSVSHELTIELRTHLPPQTTLPAPDHGHPGGMTGALLPPPLYPMGIRFE